MRRIMMICVALMTVVAASAQQSAEQWLKALNSSLGECYAMRVEVNTSADTMSGYYMVDGDSYYIELEQMEVYCNGKVRHEINNSRKEVTVDSVDPGSGDLLQNPTRAFDFVADEFKMSVAETTPTGCVVSLMPLDSSSGIVEIILVLQRNGSKVLPKNILYDYDGECYAIELEMVDVGATKLPRWNKESYSDYDMVSFI